MIIFGTRGVTYNADDGDFHCPECEGQKYHRKRVRRFFTLYFIPLIPLDKMGEYIECDGCKSTYKDSILDYQPGPGSSANVEAEFLVAIKRVMALMVIADGQVDDDEIEVMGKVFEKVAGKSVSEDDIRREVMEARAGSPDVDAYLGEVGPYLNAEGKEMIIKAAFMVAAADGHFDDSEMELLVEASKSLEMSSAHLKGILAEMQE
jgi:tellurite resistance protein